MTVVGILMCKDEIDVLPYTFPLMVRQLDHVIVSDNGSTDGTREWLTDFAFDNNITVLFDSETAYFQSRKMTRLAHLAVVDHGATVIAPFDADEVIFHPEYRLADYPFPSEIHVFEMTLFDHVVTAEDCQEEPDVIRRVGWRRTTPAPLPKVLCRSAPGLVIEAGNHGAHYPGIHQSEWIAFQVRHFPYRSVEQMARKAVNGKAAYDAAGDGLSQSLGRHWREYGTWYERGGLEAIRDIFMTWFYSDDPANDPALIYDPLP